MTNTPEHTEAVQVTDVNAQGLSVVRGSANMASFDEISLSPISPIPNDVVALTSGRLDSGARATTPTPLGGSVLLSIPVGPPPDDDSTPGVLHRHDDGSFVLIPAPYEAESGTVSVWVDSFSDFFGGWWNPVNWAEEAIQLTQGAFDFMSDWVTGRTDPPQCNNDPPAWATVTASEAASIHVCMQSNLREDGTERVEVFIKSNRSTMQAITLPTGLDYLWFESQPEWFRSISSAIAADLLPFASPQSPTIVTLFGGESMSFGFTRPTVDANIEVRALMSEAHIVANHALGLIGGLKGDTVFLMTAATYACTAEITGINLPSVGPPPSNVAEAVDVGVKCGLELLAQPELLAGLLRVMAEQVGADGELAADFVKSHVPESVAKLAGNLLTAINAAGVVVRVFDGVFDSVAEGQITLLLSAAEVDSVCSSARLATDLGLDVQSVEVRACEAGWAYVDPGGMGDVQFIAHLVDDRWQGAIYFPSPLCRDEVNSQGVPAVVADLVGWACQTTPTLPSPPEPADPAACLTVEEATQLLAESFGEVDGVSIDYCDGTIAVGGPGDFWAVWRYDSGAWTLQFYTFSGSELCEILASEDPNNSFGGWC